MAMFSTNQVRHLYVAKANKGEASKSNKPSVVGDIAYKIKDNQLYFLYKGNGGLLRSDLINLSNIRDARIAYGEDEARAMKTYTVTLSGSYVATQDYVMGVRLRGFLGTGDSNTFEVWANSGAGNGDASKTYKALAVQLALNYINDEFPLFEVLLQTSSGNVLITDEIARAKGASLTGTYTGVIVKEKNTKEDWIQGRRQITPLVFEIVDRDEVFAVTAGKDTTDKISNGRNMADLEWFCMGERGDIYRNADPIATLPVKYVIGSDDLDDAYDILNIHYFGEEDGINAGKQEKDIMIVAKHTTSENIVDAIAQVLANNDVIVTKKSGSAMTTVAKASE